MSGQIKYRETETLSLTDEGWFEIKILYTLTTIELLISIALVVMVKKGESYGYQKCLTTFRIDLGFLNTFIFALSLIMLIVSVAGYILLALPMRVFFS